MPAQRGESNQSTTLGACIIRELLLTRWEGENISKPLAPQRTMDLEAKLIKPVQFNYQPRSFAAAL